MKISFEVPTDNKMHRFCPLCHSEDVSQRKTKARVTYYCNTCTSTLDRTIYFDKHRSWLDKTNELWHESAGVFVRNPKGKFLFYMRNEFPIALTIPSGHVDKDETPEHGALRELQEEVGIHADILQHVGTEEVHNDSCSAGADAHKCSIYLHIYKGNAAIRVCEEGSQPVWLTLDQALAQNLAPAVKNRVKRYKAVLEK